MNFEAGGLGRVREVFLSVADRFVYRPMRPTAPFEVDKNG